MRNGIDSHLDGHLDEQDEHESLDRAEVDVVPMVAIQTCQAADTGGETKVKIYDRTSTDIRVANSLFAVKIEREKITM
jgi:hypothetical protein